MTRLAWVFGFALLPLARAASADAGLPESSASPESRAESPQGSADGPQDNAPSPESRAESPQDNAASPQGATTAGSADPGSQSSGETLTGDSSEATTFDPSLPWGTLADPDARDSEDEAHSVGKRLAFRITVRQLFERSSYRFCRDTSYRLHPDDRYLCKLARESDAACPGFTAACKRPDRSDVVRSSRTSSRSQGLDASAFEDLPFENAHGKRFARLLFWLVLALALTVAIASGVRRLVARRAQAPEEIEAERRKEEQAQPSSAALDADGLLARARAAAAAADYEQAMADAYWAILSFLGATGRCRLHPAATSGDYARQLEGHPEAQRAVEDAARALERVQFGAEPATVTSFQDVLRRALSILGRGALVLLVFVFGAGATACHRQPDEGFDRSWSGAPGGLLAFQELLGSYGVQTRWRVHRVDRFDDSVGTVVLLDPGLEPEEWGVLLEWVKQGGSLLVAAGRTPLEDLVGVGRAIEPCNGPLELHASYRGSDLFGQAELALPATETFEWTRQMALPIMLCGDKPYLVMTGLGEGSVALLPSADLLTNASMAAAENAYVVLRFISQPGTTLEFIGTWTGAGADTPFEAAANAQLKPWLFQLLLLMLAFFFWRGVPFAKPRSSVERPRRAFLEHVRAVGSQYRRAHATRHALSLYTPWAIERLRERVQMGQSTGLLALAQAVAARTGRSESLVVQTLVDATHAGEDPNPSDPHHLETMKILTQFVAESGGKR